MFNFLKWTLHDFLKQMDECRKWNNVVFICATQSLKWFSKLAHWSWDFFFPQWTGVVSIKPQDFPKLVLFGSQKQFWWSMTSSLLLISMYFWICAAELILEKLHQQLFTKNTRGRSWSCDSVVNWYTDRLQMPFFCTDGVCYCHVINMTVDL